MRELDYLRFALEVLHDVEKVVVHVWLVLELNLDRIEVAECVGDVEGTGNELWHGGERDDDREKWEGVKKTTTGSAGTTRTRWLPEETKASTLPPS